MKKNKTIDAQLDWRINRVGNWNRLTSSSPVFTKPITQIFIDGDEFVWKHEEILELIKAYYQSDVEAIKMIKDGVSGDVKNFEKPLLEKIKELIVELEKNDKIL